jgi:hypothetical protein
VLKTWQFAPAALRPQKDVFEEIITEILRFNELIYVFIAFSSF